MMKKKSNKFKYLYLLSIPILAGIFQRYINPLLPPENKIQVFFNSLFSTIGDLLFYSFKVNFLLFVIIVGLALFKIAEIVRNIINRNRRPNYYQYKKDKFFDIKWRWTYPLKADLRTLIGFCPDCNTRLALVEGYLPGISTDFVCETCQKTIHKFDTDNIYDILGRVIRQIERVITTGKWQERYLQMIQK